MSNLYLNRYAWPHSLLNNYSQFKGIGNIVVIPSYNESSLIHTLTALDRCDQPNHKVLVLVIINESDDADEHITHTNQKTYDEASVFQSWFQIEVIYQRLPKKKAGVGLARKIGMDEAVRIFDYHQVNGIITCLDADCTCSENYFRAIESYFESSKRNLGVLYYEHPTSGENSDLIIKYELFLRYYIDALRWAGFPYAFQTLGSCIAVKSSAYQKQGGMNTRKAGEDFYFIHKMMPLGDVGEINEAGVYPSDRVSDRVPFGTGHAVQKQLKSPQEEYYTYDPKVFRDLKIVFSGLDHNFSNKEIPKDLPESVRAFYTEMNFDNALAKMLSEANNPGNFEKKFFAWWDGFRVLKFIHFARDHFYPNIPIQSATEWLAESYLDTSVQELTLKQQLQLFRKADRDATFKVSGKGPLRQVD